ncbi:MAG: Gfo/Idh/MocA family oxidoreductase [Oscillospiraceae bacterium]|nr:Gfo/Idh/MocA family oxidoreductase [Oscillospiraceae bacterium]
MIVRKIQKFISLAILVSICLFPPANSFYESDKTVDLAGKGISVRLHEPIVKELGLKTRFVRIPENDSDFINENSEFLIVGTQPEKHINCILNSIHKYKKILCEKPVGVSYAEIENLEKLIEDSKTQIRVNYQLRFHPKLKEISDFARNNTIKTLKISYMSNFGNALAAQDWKNDMKTGGGIIYSILPHIIDAINFLELNAGSKPISQVETTDENNIPMTNIKVYFNSFMLIDLDVTQKFDEFTFTFVTDDGQEKVFDLIADNELFSENHQYSNGYLLSKNDCSFWRKCFKNLLETFFRDPDDCRLTTLADAKKVLYTIDEILKIVLNNQ